MAKTPFIEIRDVSRRFVAVQALANINLTVNQGEIHALVGENGAGKSTLGKIISGIERPDSGQLSVLGEQRAYTHPIDALRDGITTITQEIALLNKQTVINNILLGEEIQRGGVLNRQAMLRKFKQLVQSTGFDLQPNIPVQKLRLADKKKVEVLRAIARDAKLIIMDEPTAMLADDETKIFLQIVRDLQARGHTIIYISHFLDEVLALADTVTVMRNGQIVRTAATSEETVTSLVEAMLGRTLSEMYPPRVLPLPEAPVALEVQDLRSSVFANLNLQVRAGEIVALSGLVGSGRSRLARTLFGLEEQHGGVVRVMGHTVKIRTTADAIRAGIFMLPESRKEQGLLLKQNIRSNLTLPHLHSVTHRGGIINYEEETRRIRQLLETLNVQPPLPSLPVNRLSGGNQQRVLFGKWLFERPNVFLVDEPTRGVDIGAKRGLYRLVAQLAADGVAILLISSEIDEILGLAHRVYVMRLGQIVAEFGGAQGPAIAKKEIMAAAFGAAVPTKDRAISSIH